MPVRYTKTVKKQCALQQFIFVLILLMSIQVTGITQIIFSVGKHLKPKKIVTQTLI